MQGIFTECLTHWCEQQFPCIRHPSEKDDRLRIGKRRKLSGRLAKTFPREVIYCLSHLVALQSGLTHYLCRNLLRFNVSEHRWLICRFKHP